MSQPPTLDYATKPVRRAIASRIMSMLLAAWCVLLLFHAAHHAGLIEAGFIGSGYQYYSFTTPFLWNVALTAVLAFVAALMPVFRWRFFAPAAAAVVQPLTCFYAIEHWPGGDDGGGMAWMFLVIPPALLSGAYGLTLAMVGLVQALNARKSVHH